MESQERRCIADNHSHTYLCGHAELVKPRILQAVANAMNFKYYAFCCHNPFIDNSVTPQYRMKFAQFEIFLSLYEKEKQYAAKNYPDMTLLLGMEVDWHPEDSSKTEQFVNLCDKFDFLLGSLHYYEDRIEEIEDQNCFVMHYYDEWEKAFESGYFEIMSHMDFYKVVLGKEWFASNCHNQAIQSRAMLALDHLAEYNHERIPQSLSPVALEVNTGCSEYEGLDMTLPSENIIAHAIALGIPISLGSDAHFAEEVGRNMRDVLIMLERYGLEKLCFFVAKEIHYYSLSAALDSLAELNHHDISEAICTAKKAGNWKVD